MIWILVIISFLHGDSVAIEKFDSQGQCEAAKSATQAVVDGEQGFMGAGPRVKMACKRIS